MTDKFKKWIAMTKACTENNTARLKYLLDRKKIVIDDNGKVINTYTYYNQPFCDQYTMFKYLEIAKTETSSNIKQYIYASVNLAEMVINSQLKHYGLQKSDLYKDPIFPEDYEKIVPQEKNVSSLKEHDDIIEKIKKELWS